MAGLFFWSHLTTFWSQNRLRVSIGKRQTTRTDRTCCTGWRGMVQYTVVRIEGVFRVGMRILSQKVCAEVYKAVKIRAVPLADIA
jgi:hypothetical protein